MAIPKYDLTNDIHKNISKLSKDIHTEVKKLKPEGIKRLEAELNVEVRRLFV